MAAVCYLHIGTEKTGSTSLQSFLEGSAVKLRDSGVLYVDYPGSMQMVNQVRSNSLGTGYLSSMAEASDYYKVIISNEHFSLLLPDEIVRLKHALTIYFGDKDPNIRIVIYLRPQYEVAISSYSTALRKGLINHQLLEFSIDPYWKYNYLAIIQAWQSVFGCQNVIVRDFHALEKENIIYDFCSLVGIQQDPEASITFLNRGLNKTALAFLQRLYYGEKTKERLIGSDLADLITEALDEAYSGQGPQPSRTDVERFMAPYRVLNAQLVRERPWLWGGDPVPGIEKFPEQTQPIEVSLTEMFDVVRHVLSFCWLRSKEMLADRERHVASLTQANQQLLFHARSLDTANKQLVADAEGLRAANQELLDHARSLDSAYKQLTAEAERLRSFNQKLLMLGGADER